jgi:hypothetical protein
MRWTVLLVWDVGHADNDTMRLQHSAPQLPIPPLIWFVHARNVSDGDREVGHNDCLLLSRERDCRRQDPGDLGGRFCDV